MIYTKGTVSTVSGSAIVKGTDTKFKNNNPAINIGMTILIKSGITNIPYMIKSVNSDTELVLAQPALATATNTTFSIHITEPDNNSDAARTMVAINSYVEYFLDAMNTWMSETGQTKIEMPNGEIVTLDSIKKMQRDISNKFDKAGGKITGDTAVDGLLQSTVGRVRATKEGATINLECDAAGPRIASLYPNSNWGIHKLPTSSGTFMQLGDCGIGDNNVVINYLPDIDSVDYKNGTISFFNTNTKGALPFSYGYIHAFNARVGTGIVQVAYEISTGRKINIAVRDNLNNAWGKWVKFYNTDNTTVDPQGFIKKASPVVNINPDGTFTTNDESEGATVTQVAQGEYLIEGVLGFNSDAGWGGVDGGIEIPLDVNKQPLIWVDAEINKDGSILVKTYHRTHPNAPEFANNKIDGFNDGDPIDIPDGRFISVRVQMPEQSIYNVRMREMEEAQKAEEERRQKEEEMKKQFGLGENDVLL
ncbi:hypothetical protein NAG84_14655 [Proteus terrae]|uniref:phage tail fiber protein n=1 Tax=Proteus terrae TaxID=1574161 RepID=UPI002095FE18|nr:hypothetical protein [Proteus terrae]MCO7051087.1 hypothetical protein [Proteus terrae]